MVRARTAEGDLDAELMGHVEARADDLRRRGVAAEEARRQARLELGAVGQWKEECREAQGYRWADELRQDTRFAVRTLSHAPGFSLVAIVSLALGIGANTAVFGVLNSLLLKPLAVEEPARVVSVQNRSGFPTHSFPNYRDFRDRNTTFSGMYAARVAPMGLETAQGSYRVWGYLATGNYFDVLGIKPALGRFFHQEDDRNPGASPFAVLSYTSWQSRFGGDREIAGKTVRIGGRPYTVLGVAPQGFQGTEVFYWPEIWVPMMMQAQIEDRNWLDDRATFNAWVGGRVKPGVEVRQAEADLARIAGSLEREYPRFNEALTVKLGRPGLAGDVIRRPLEAFTVGVLALSGMVLLAACANLASLLAARTADRQRELAIRLSIGAGRGRLLRQMLTEASVLSSAGGAAGCVVAVILLRMLSQWRSPLDFPVQFETTPDGRVLLLAVLSAIVAGLLSGVAPARHAWRMDPNGALKGLPAGSIRGWPFRDVLLAVQVAICCVLVTGCFVSLRGLSKAFEMPLGFQPRGVVVAGLDLGLARYSKEEGQRFQKKLLESVSQLPGMKVAAYANSVPLSIDQSMRTVFPEQTREFRLGEGVSTSYYQVSPGYFEVAGTRVLRGREFTWRDDGSSPQVAIVNETLAKKLTGNGDATGRRCWLGRGRPVEIVAVVEDGKYRTLTEEPTPTIFLPASQSYNGTMVVLARSAVPEDEMAGRLRDLIRSLDSRLPVYGVGSWTQMLGFAFFPAHAATVALSAFGVLAILLAVTGIYGLASYSVSRRTRDIGIRMAIGARPAAVLRHVLGRTGMLVVAGSVVGLLLGVAGAQLLASIVYQADARDPVVLVAAAVAMVGIGFVSVWEPARRALSVRPIQALRQD